MAVTVPSDTANQAPSSSRTMTGPSAPVVGRAVDCSPDPASAPVRTAVARRVSGTQVAVTSWSTSSRTAPAGCPPSSTALTHRDVGTGAA